ncbi:TPA: YggT family protein, partial [Streptococcus pyogenes]
RAFNLQFAGLDFTIFVVIISLNFLAQVLVRVFI